MNYDLVEIFESMQGEGRNTGRPCGFIRFAGCNLACPWCDTCVEKRFSMSLDGLVAEARRFRSRSVVLTGGEPTRRRHAGTRRGAQEGGVLDSRRDQRNRRRAVARVRRLCGLFAQGRVSRFAEARRRGRSARRRVVGGRGRFLP
ncbi:MAG: 7-carboxy-7-deazaguanine synthase QueE [Kiritimatiellae bacterium]|nr:7-carboxy-7-deazaguanine synthase QueE [Kiritimatiellia bacterium]